MNGPHHESPGGGSENRRVLKRGREKSGRANKIRKKNNKEGELTGVLA